MTDIVGTRLESGPHEGVPTFGPWSRSYGGELRLYSVRNEPLRVRLDLRQLGINWNEHTNRWKSASEDPTSLPDRWVQICVNYLSISCIRLSNALSVN